MFGLGAPLIDVPDEDLVELARTGEAIQKDVDRPIRNQTEARPAQLLRFSQQIAG
ncbi:MAG: hypothetical protein JJE05_00155 [Actinobacteria bacterium]|nr:hypothetical protein [Actinomycetota bacterium]